MSKKSNIFTFKISPDTMEKFEEACKRLGLNKSEAARRALEDWIIEAFSRARKLEYGKEERSE